jgi:dimethylaniline monooxygenase (N-oxide forming)
MCTGYNIDFPFLDDELRSTILPGHNSLDLYKYVFSPDVGPSLAFIGFVQTTTGGILSVSEMQARWFVQLCKGNIRLPSKNSMKTSLYREREKNRKRFYASPRHTIQVDPIVYNDEVASFFGARPSFWRHPLLTWRLLLGSGGASQWRLDGPDIWQNAREQIVKVPVPELMIGIGSLLVLLLFVVLCSLVALFW